MFRGVVFLGAGGAGAAGDGRGGARPRVTTGGTANLHRATATLNGSVNPKGRRRVLLPVRLNSSTAPDAEHRRPGRKALAVSVPVAGARPATVYHYRIVAVNADGTTLGADRTFKTKVQPLGLTLKATPDRRSRSAARACSPASSTGTNGRGRQVQLRPARSPTPRASRTSARRS